MLVAIANHANHTDGYCWLKAETIAHEAACTPRSVYNFVGALIRNGFIRKALRKGEDGKQRATDYWILFGREEKPWDNSAHLESDEAEPEASDEASAEERDTTSSVPPESLADGEPPESTCQRQPVEMSPRSCGPVESGFRRSESLNHPNLILKQESAPPEQPHARALRAYRPPPPQPVAADTEQKTNPVFVYEGTPAFEAWCKFKAEHAGKHRWHLTTRAQIHGKWCTGWWFPTLYPPPKTKSGEISDSDAKAFTGDG